MALEASPNLPCWFRDTTKTQGTALDATHQVNTLLCQIQIRYRPLLIAAALLFPLGGLFCFMWIGFSNDLEFARMEICGNRFQRPLERLLKLLPEHRGLKLGVLGNEPGAGAAASAKGIEIEAALAMLREADLAVGRDLDFTSERLRQTQREGLLASRMQERWTELKNTGMTQNADAIRAAHDRLIGDVRAAISYAGDTSKLILDPELDTYYLVDVTLGALPSHQERLARLTDFLSQSPALEAAQRMPLAVLANQIRESDFDRVLGSLAISGRETARLRGDAKAFQSTLEGPLQRYRTAAEELLSALDAGVTNSSTTVATQELRRRSETTREASFALWDASVNELDRLLNLRIDGFRAKRARACWVVGIFLVGAALVFWIVVQSITRPLLRLKLATHALANGDLTTTIPACEQKDELGDLARATQTMKENLRRLLLEVAEGVQTMASASTELSAASNQSAVNAKASSEKAALVTSAAEEMTSSASSVATGIGKTTENLNMVASATEEMTSTIGEIARKSEQARAITAEANQQAGRVTELMSELNRAADAIGKVSETITTISEQTNLLALNATIEAARAGAAGKGFAVVAHEIKDLARLTAEATEDIKNKVSGIQSSTHGAVSDLQRIAEVIHHVTENVNTIASAIEEQSAVTKDIAHNVAEAAHGVKSCSAGVSQISEVSGAVAKDLASVNLAATEIVTGSEQVLMSSQDLSKLAEALRGTVGRFNVGQGSETGTFDEFDPLPVQNRIVQRHPEAVYVGAHRS